MHTIIFLTKNKPGVSVEEYFQHYHTTHYELAQRLPGLVSYRQLPIRTDVVAVTDVPDFLAVSEYTFESDDAAEAAWASPEGVAVNEDTGLFMDWETVVSLPVRRAQEWVAASE